MKKIVIFFIVRFNIVGDMGYVKQNNDNIIVTCPVMKKEIMSAKRVRDMQRKNDNKKKTCFRKNP